MYKTLTTSVAAIALMTGAAFAQSDTEADATLNADTSAQVEADTATEELENDVEQAGDAAADAASDTAEAVENTAEDAADATAEAAEDATNAAEETAEDVAESAEETAEEATDSDMAADTETETEMSTDSEAVTSTEGGMDASFSGMLVGDILGQNVRTQSGEDVGEIDYVVRQGEDLAAVIGIGGFLGLGEYTVAIPLEEFSMAAEGEGLMLSSWTEEELKAQPEFDETGVEGLEDDVPLDSAM